MYITLYIGDNHREAGPTRQQAKQKMTNWCRLKGRDPAKATKPKECWIPYKLHLQLEDDPLYWQLYHSGNPLEPMSQGQKDLIASLVGNIPKKGKAQKGRIRLSRRRFSD